MATKIRETINVIKAGARNNKYKIIYPFFGNEIDVLCHATSMPGREIGTVEVYLKGRKYQMAGDRTDDGTWSMTIYNTKDFLVRNFFLKVLYEIQSFNTPVTMFIGYNQIPDPFTTFNYAGTGSNLNSATPSSNGDFLNTIGFDKLSDAMYNIKTAFDALRNNINSFGHKGYSTRDDINYGVNLTYNESGFVPENIVYQNRPWYMTDIIIQQLDENQNPATVAVLNNAFITNVGNVEYNDETGNISTTELTFAYSGIDFTEEGYYVNF